MKTIGLIGGMSWESSAEYYRIINQAVARERGGHSSARLVMVSVDFAEVEALQQAGGWDSAASLLADAARSLEAAGAGCVVICTNTMHLVADEVQAAVTIPLIHIADATAEAVSRAGLPSVGLLGTRFTMEMDFYKGRLVDRHGLAVLVPSETDRTTVHDVIYDELVHGEIVDSSRHAYLEIIDRLVGLGAQGVILGCTEIGLLVDDTVTDVPLFDTTRIHAEAAVSWALLS
ncbi:MAG: aspartate/glutamate racemase family protein [Acidimicrobiia bacterium]|nr:aspartate/glutamate racemase family protein [Acidimicrobiia bacterium]NNC75363.1 aspartate/glutamate racemase family protein [Acidimicrobiia bacterium]